MNAMTNHVLNGAFERVARAEKHLTDLRLALAEWLVEQENALIPQFDPNPPHNLIPDVSNCVGPPLIVGVLIGEIAYNLRSALDYLVFELAKLDSGIEQSATQFPIENTKESFDYRAKTRGLLKGINTAHAAAIERLQPYTGCKWTGILRDISNPDKHREFARIRGNYTVFVSHSLNEPNASRFAAIARSIRRAYHPLIRAEVDMKLVLTSTITLDDGTPVTQALEQIQLEVANTLALFKTEF